MASDLIPLPSKINDLLSRETSLAGFVNDQLRLFQDWVKGSGTPFFPGYTDHGGAHLTRVADACAWLIAEEAWAELTPKDAACLVLSVLLHDLAMHLTPDSFRSLVADDTGPAFPHVDTQSWSQLWEEYQREIRYWDARTWSRIAGNDLATRLRAVPGQPFGVNLANLSEAEMPVVGEFIRRHHPRLAHEFARFGVPGPHANDRLSFDTTRSRGSAALLDLAGLVARSHGQSIRDTYPYLTTHYFGTAEVEQVHPVFLMAVLRVADYLDLYAERASETLLKVREIHSAYSRREWEAHHAIREIRYAVGSDPERVDIIAMPESAHAYQKILEWTSGIQRELDHSWAVIGETFGRIPRLSGLKLRIRRVDTPLADAGFAKVHALAFEPQLASFSVEADKLLRLLVAPLYGDNPEIAVRELVQNAVDAVREVDVALRSLPRQPQRSLYPLITAESADVVVALGTRGHNNTDESDLPAGWDQWLEVTDRGIGMTAEVVRNFFLKAGASIRYSPEWDRLFTRQEQAEILRSGKFGIGVLAAFLGGGTIQVTTRSVQEEDGIIFVCEMDTIEEGIELTRTRVPEGTRVRVQLDENTFARLAKNTEERSPGASRAALDWYALEYPRIALLRIDGGTVTHVDRRYVIPSPEKESEWRHVSVSEPYPCELQWTFAKKHPHLDIYHNGIFVQTVHYQDFRQRFGDQLKAPVLNVLDPTDRFPLTIARNSLRGEVPFKDNLICELLLAHVAWLFIQAGLEPDERTPFSAETWKDADYGGGAGDAVWNNSAYAATANGILPLTHWHLTNARIRELYCVVSNQIESLSPTLMPSEPAAVYFGRFVIYGGFREPRESVVRRYLLTPVNGSAWRTETWSILTNKQVAARAGLSPHTLPLGAHFADMGDFVFVGTEAPFPNSEIQTRFPTEAAAASERGEDSGSLIRLLLDAGQRRPPSSLENVFAELWTELRLPAVIPYSLEERRGIVKRAPPKLVYHLDVAARALQSNIGLRVDRWWL
jgi:hypothetical protein